MSKNLTITLHVCPRCGQARPTTDNYCHDCGTHVDKLIVFVEFGDGRITKRHVNLVAC